MSKKRRSKALKLAGASLLGFTLLASGLSLPEAWIVPVVLIGIVAVISAPHFDKIFKRAPGHLYEFKVRHPRTGREVSGYIGKTRRSPEIRREEHMGNGSYGKPAKPWTDTITDWRVIYSSDRVSEWGLDLREKLYIKMKRPLYNYTHNLKNFRRISKNEAKAQRRRRDRMRHGTKA